MSAPARPANAEIIGQVQIALPESAASRRMGRRKSTTPATRCFGWWRRLLHQFDFARPPLFGKERLQRAVQGEPAAGGRLRPPRRLPEGDHRRGVRVSRTRSLDPQGPKRKRRRDERSISRCRNPGSAKRRERGKGRARRHALFGGAEPVVVDEIAARADEAPLRHGSRRAAGAAAIGSSARCGGLSSLADRDAPALPRDQIDAEILVAEGGAQRAGDVEIAAAGRRIDVGRAAAPVLADRPQTVTRRSGCPARPNRTPTRRGGPST